MRLFEHQAHAHSYRAKLEAFYHILTDVDDIPKTPHTITQGMDNEGGIETLAQPITNPRQTMGIDMNVVMTYNKLREERKHQI